MHTSSLAPRGSARARLLDHARVVREHVHVADARGHALLLEGVQGRGLEVVVAVVGLLVAAVHGLEVRRVDLEAPHDPVEADTDDGELVGREVDADAVGRAI